MPIARGMAIAYVWMNLAAAMIRIKSYLLLASMPCSADQSKCSPEYMMIQVTCRRINDVERINQISRSIQVGMDVEAL